MPECGEYSDILICLDSLLNHLSGYLTVHLDILMITIINNVIWILIICKA